MSLKSSSRKGDFDVRLVVLRVRLLQASAGLPNLSRQGAHSVVGVRDGIIPLLTESGPGSGIAKR